MKANKNDEKKITLTQQEYDELKTRAEERDDCHNKWLSVHAEYENTRKRMERDKTDSMRFANEGIIAQLFPIMDNFDMAFAAMDKAEDKEALLDGIKLVQKEFHRILEDNGVKRIKTEGEFFDPNIHEAITAEETDEYPDGTILKEFRPGYMLNDRLLRPAQVIVAKNEKE